MRVFFNVNNYDFVPARNVGAVQSVRLLWDGEALVGSHIVNMIFPPLLWLRQDQITGLLTTNNF